MEKLSPMVNAGLDFMLNAMKDENSHVKDTTAWTLGRIFELKHQPAAGFSIVTPANLQRILAVMLEGLKDAPHVAEKVCGAIYFLALGYEDAGPTSSLLTPFLPDIFSSLIATAERTDSSESKLRSSAYEALNQVVREKPLFVVYFSSTVHEEAMLAIGALAYATGPDFENYMQEFYKVLEMGLQNFEEYQVCTISVGVVGDICRALDGKILPYCDGILTRLLKDLSSSELDLSVKPPIFSCFGGIALAIGEHFEKYLTYAVPMMQRASEICAQIDSNDEDMGFKNAKAELMLPHAPHLLQFIELVAKDQQRDESVTKTAVGVLGDLAEALGSNLKMMIKDGAFCTELLGECLQSGDDQLKETATWTQGMIGRVYSNLYY
ncbi:importin subunit beta-1-like [Salvia divinorum]|uniref:Importin subunit beta-1-like n=1 Tax=Salvia divinorum TaxID=28513 RepID=A0ABD1GYP1_SALDI